MKSVMFHLLLAGAPPFLSWHLAGVIFTLGTFGAPITSLAAPEESKEVEIIVTAYTDEDTAPVVVVRKEETAAKSDGRSNVRMTRVVTEGSGDHKQRAWLGVYIDEVPEALAAQLNTKGPGVLISNVVTGSPADKAGFQAHDILLAVNGESVGGARSRAVDLIGSQKPGDTVGFVVLRDGKETTLTATLGSRPDVPSAFFWKFETAPNAEVTEHIKTRGKFIRRGPGGEWIVKDLGNLENLADMPENIRVFVPKGGERTTHVTVEGGVKTIRTKVKYDDGSTVIVEQKDDGPITVRRTNDDGTFAEGTYDDPGALRAADEEVFMIFEEAGGVEVTGGVTVDGDFDFDVDFDSDAWKDSMLEWRTQLDSTLAEANEAYTKAMEEVRASLEKLKSERGQGALKLAELHGFMQPGADGRSMAMGLAHMGKPRNSFEVRADGTIEVRVRKGDSELVQLYTNESDLQQRNADLYQKYQELKSIKE